MNLQTKSVWRKKKSLKIIVKHIKNKKKWSTVKQIFQESSQGLGSVIAMLNFLTLVTGCLGESSYTLYTAVLPPNNPWPIEIVSIYAFDGAGTKMMQSKMLGTILWCGWRIQKMIATNKMSERARKLHRQALRLLVLQVRYRLASVFHS